MIIRSKLDQWCDGILEAGWLAALVVAPMFFNVYSSRVFEPDKISLVRSIALVMVLAWLIKIANGGYGWLPKYSATPPAETPTWREAAHGAWRNPFAIPILAMVVVYALSTLFSLAPYVSWFGSYQRLQGTFSYFAYIIIGVLTAATLRSPDQIRRLTHVIIITSVPIAIYGFLQNRGVDPLPWGGDTQRRITSNAGNAIFLGAWLLFAMAFTVERIISSFMALVRKDDEPGNGDLIAAVAGGIYIFVLVAQSFAMVWTLSRGPWMGIAAALFLMVLLLPIALRPRNYLIYSSILVAIGVFGIGLLLALNLFFTAQVANIPYINRLSQMLDLQSTTAQVRAYIWEGSSELVSPHDPLIFPDGSTDSLNPVRPLVGYGPEAMWVAFNKFYPPGLTLVEARNASPDRSHNETWDSLVITGLLGLIAFLSLFISIFYWSLRWLGLIQNKRDSILFGVLLALWAVGLSIGAWMLDDGQLRYLGVAFPFGLVFGTIVYIMIAAFLHRDWRPERVDTPRALLIITIFAAIVGHFVEIHFGISIGATRTYFWVLTGLLLALGMRWAQPQFMASWQDAREGATEGEANAAQIPAAAASSQGKSTKAKQATRQPARRPQRNTGVALPWTPLTVLTDALVFLVAVFIYTTNASGEEGAFAILINSITMRNVGGTPQWEGRILLLLLLTWLTAVLIGLSVEALRQRTIPPLSWWLKALGLHFVIVWGSWLLYGLIQANRVAPITVPPTLATATEQLNYQLQHIANHFAWFTAVMILWMVVAGTVYALRELRAARVVPWATRPIVSVAVGLVAAIGVFVTITNVNVGLVRADIIYKQGQQFDNQGNYVDSIELYRRALAARETEDYYMLFLGRALLEQAKRAAPGTGTAGFPAEPTLDDVLALRPETTMLMGQDDLLLAAEAVLTQAQEVNPLNTDHSANLARLYQSWADLRADDPELRAQLLERSIAEFRTATTLSPNAALLWDQMGNAYLASGDSESAEQAFLHALEIDPFYEQTYLLLADLYDNLGRTAESIPILQQGIERIGGRLGENATVQLNSFLGVALSRTGDVTGAIESMQQMLAVDPTNLTAMRNLALLYRDSGDLNSAVEWMERTMAATPADSTEMPQLRATLNDLYQQLALANPDDYQWYFRLAQSYQEGGDTPTALIFATQALSAATTSQQPVVQSFIDSLQ